MKRKRRPTTKIRTHSGAMVGYAESDTPKILLMDIVYSLSYINRFLGHVPFPYSVALHSLLVAEWLRVRNYPKSIVFWGLMHDAAEAYVGDMPQPLKRGLPEYQEYEDRIMDHIRAEFDLRPKEEPEIVRRADAIVGVTERHVLFGPSFEDQEADFLPDAATARRLRKYLLVPPPPDVVRQVFYYWYSYCTEGA